MAKPKISLRGLLIVVAVVGILIALHGYITLQFEQGWKREQQFIGENGFPAWPEAYYPNLEVETSSIVPSLIQSTWPCSDNRIFMRVTRLDTTAVGTWEKGYELCSVFRSVREVRLTDSDCDIPRLVESFAAFPDLADVEIHLGWGSRGNDAEIASQIEHSLPHVNVRLITGR